MKKLLLAVVMFGASLSQASIVINLAEVGPDVVMSYSGSMDLSGLSNTYNGAVTGGMNSGSGVLRNGTGNISAYFQVVGPDSFGTLNTFTNSTSSTGDIFAILMNLKEFEVPQGYISNSPLSGTGTWSSTNFATLGVTPGNYVWTAGANTITLNAVAAIPEPTTYIALAGFAGLGFFVWRRRKQALPVA